MPSLSLAPYRALLRRPGTVRLVATSVLARMPSGMGGLSLVLLVQSSTGSFGLAGLVAGAFTIGISAGGPLQGRLIDRLGQTRVLPETLEETYERILTALKQNPPYP